MTTVVLDSKDLIASLQTGEIPVPAEVAADNAAQAAKKASGKTEPVVEAKEPPKEPVKEPVKAADDDVEGEDGLTPRQKRELTEKMQKAIGKKHRERKEAEEFAADQYNNRRLAERKVEQLERELRALKEQAVPPPVEDTKPKRENFETDDAFRDAVDNWRVDQKFKAKEAEVKQAIEQQRQNEVMEAAKVRIAKALELVPDYQEVTESVDMEVPPVIAGYMQESEMFAELGYHFAKHPEVLERLGKLTPARALVEVGKIESKLQPFAQAESAKETSKSNGHEPSTETGIPPSKTRATAPVITPLTTNSGAQVEDRVTNVRDEIQAWQRKRGVHLNIRKRH